MSVVHPDIRFTYEDYRSLPESMEKRHELLDGNLIVVPSPTTRHQIISRNLEFLLHAFVKEHRLGEVLDSPIDLVLGTGDQREIVQPDIVYIRRERSTIIAEQEIQGAPDLVVEILSPGTESRDRGYKKRLYGRYGVPEYWIVDPQACTIELFRIEGGAYASVAGYGSEDKLISPLFPGLEIELREVFHLD